MKILVLGGSGMAGHVIALHLRESGYTVDTLSSQHSLDEHTHFVDATNIQRLDMFFAHHSYDVIVNAIALLVKSSDEHKDTAAYLNAYLPHYLEARFNDSQTKIIHLSTDGVFSGSNEPYPEDHPYTAQDYYGRSKALGELINTKDLTIRMSIIGPELRADGAGLFNWSLGQREALTGYRTVLWNGVTTVELAKGIEAMIKHNTTGIFHFAPRNCITKYDLLKLLLKIFDRQHVTLEAVDSKVFKRALLCTRTDLPYVIPSYETMVDELRDWIRAHSTLYSHYHMARI